MDYIKPDPDGELYLTSSQNENQQIDVKEEEDPLLIKLPVASSENEFLQQNIDTIKVEQEACVFPPTVATERGEVTDIKRSLSLSQTAPLIKHETQVTVDDIKSERTSYSETCLTSSWSETGIDIREDGGPTLTTFPVMKAENKSLNVSGELLHMSSQTAATETHKGNIATGRTLCPHDVCSKAFSSQNELGTNQHVQGEENHYYYIFSEEAFGLRVKHQRLDTCTLYLCDVCNRTFCNQTYLEEHQRVHMGEPPYSCDGCNKPFVVHEHLTVHQHIHTKKEPQYSCGACKRAFANQKHLMQHHRVQSRERPFLCCMCNNDYKYDCNLKRHLRKHT